MPEHLRALVVILVLATAVFVLARAPVCTATKQHVDFVRRRNLWFAITLIAFLSGNIWIYVVLAAIVLLITLHSEKNRMALFLALVFAVPPVAAELSGLGLMEHLFAINHPRLLALTILLPTFLQIMTRRDRVRFGRLWPDRLLLAYVLLNFGMMLYATTFTNAVRLGIFCAFLDVFLPYFVASRSLTSIESLRDTLTAFVVAALVLSAVALFEWLKHWLVYSSLLQALDLQWGYGRYLARSGAGLRAQASTGHPIALGFAISVAIGLFLYVRTAISNPLPRRVAFALLAGGLVATLSRGPWIGTAVTLFVFVGTGQRSGWILARIAAAGLVALLLGSTIPGVRNMMEYLPFVGSVDSANVEYRQRLIELAISAIWQSPLFGGIDIYSIEGTNSLRQGQGGMFIDVVNTYVGILLGSGFTGLALFLGFFLTIGANLRRAIQVAPSNPDYVVLGRALLASLAGVLVTILTTSSITIIPIVYWSLAGIAVAYTQLRGGEQLDSSRGPLPLLTRYRVPFRASPTAQ